MVNEENTFEQGLYRFLSHLHDGELFFFARGFDCFFLSHLHDGEPNPCCNVKCLKFLSHLHDGEHIRRG